MRRALIWLTQAVILITIAACDKKPTLKFGSDLIEPADTMISEIQSSLSEEFNFEDPKILSNEDLITALQAGEIDAAIVERSSAPIPGIAALLPLYPSVLHILVRDELVNEEQNGNFSELVKQGSIFAGTPGSAGHRLLTQLGEQGVIPSIDKLNILSSIFAELPDIFILFGGILDQDSLSRMAGYRLLSLGEVEDLGQGSLVEGIALRFPNIQPFVIPQGMYPSLANKAVVSLSVPSMLIVRDDLPQSTAYRLTQHITKHVSLLRAVYPLAFNSEFMMQTNQDYVLPLHEGARRLIEQDKPSFLERYAEVLALAVAVMLALSSVVIGWLRSRRQARKDRIDVYFDQLLEMRNAIKDSESSTEPAAQVVALQGLVTKLVVDERISADSSYVSFIALSNQVLKEANNIAK